MEGIGKIPRVSLVASHLRLVHRGRNQRYSFQIDLDYGSSTLQFLQFWNQNVVNILFLVVKSLEVISGFISKLMKKNSRWRHYWNIWHLSVKTKISPLLGRPQGSLGCQKMRHYPLNLDLGVWCSNIQPKLKKLWNSTKTPSFLIEFHSFFNFGWILEHRTFKSKFSG